MRDYITLWRQTKPNENFFTWFLEDQGNSDPESDPFYRTVKIYVRIPDRALLLRWFNTGITSFSTNYVSINGNHFSLAEGWGNIFGATTVGGYAKLTDVPTSDAYGALHGRPARDDQGRFI
jgi:hypothetical protein